MNGNNSNSTGLEEEGENLYKTLNLNKTATPEEIKKAYRKLALRYHPDKNPNCEDQFRTINHAYEILSDPQKRRIYDRYGSVGLNMADTMGGAMFLDPEVEAMVLAFFCLVSIILVSILIWLIFICLKVDRSIQWPWSIVFIPLWIVDALILWATFYRMKNYDPIKNEELNNNHRQHEDEVDEEEDGNEEDGLLGSSATNKKTTPLQHKFNQFIPFVQCCLMLTFQILIVLRLDGQLKTIVWIFSPFYLYELVNTIKNGKKGWLTRTVMVVQMTFIMLQLLFLHRGYSWFIVFIPLYCLGLFYALKLYRQYKIFGSYPQRQEAHQGQMIVTIGSIIFGLFAALFYTVLGLVIRRLDGSSHVRMALILIPVFMILGVLLCCTGFCLPCMLVASALPTEDLEDPLNRQEPLVQQLVNSNRRITEQGSSNSN